MQSRSVDAVTNAAAAAEIVSQVCPGGGAMTNFLSEEAMSGLSPRRADVDCIIVTNTRL